MADFSTLARPYAKAAYDYANEHNVTNAWEDFLFVASSIVNDKSFRAVIEDPSITAAQKVDALVDLYDTQVVKADDSAFKQLLASTQMHRSPTDQQYDAVTPELKNFVMQLAQQERLALLPEIHGHFRRYKSRSEQQIDAYITTAMPLTNTQRALFQTKLAASLNANVVIHETVDPSLIAGATIKIGDKVVDDSMRGKLQQLRTQLTA